MPTPDVDNERVDGNQLGITNFLVGKNVNMLPRQLMTRGLSVPNPSSKRLVGSKQSIDRLLSNSRAITELYSAGRGIRPDFAHGFETEFTLAWRGMSESSVQNLGLDRLRGLFRVVKRF